MDDVQLADVGLSILVELEVSDEFSAVFCFLVAKFEANFCLFIDLLSRCLVASSAFLAFASAFFLAAASLCFFALAPIFTSLSLPVAFSFSPHALVSCLSIVNWSEFLLQGHFDADDSLVLGVVLGMYCTRYFDMYFSSPLAPPLVGVWFLDDGVTEDVDDGVVVTEPGVHTEGLVDCGVELGAGVFTLAADISGDVDVAATP